MTHVQRNWLQKWLPTVVAFVALGIHLIVVGRWAGQQETRMDAMEKHADSSEIHMPLKETVEFFITRREAEKADKEFRSALDKIVLRTERMESKIDFLYEQAQRKASVDTGDDPFASASAD